MEWFTQSYIAQYICNLGCSISRASISHYMRAHSIVRQKNDKVVTKQIILPDSIQKQQVVKYICANYSTLTLGEHINLEKLKQRDSLIATLHELVSNFKTCLNNGNCHHLYEWIELTSKLKQPTYKSRWNYT